MTQPEGAGERLARIRETLHPTRRGYAAEPLDIEDARWLLAALLASAPAPAAEPLDLFYRINVFREDDGRFAAEYMTADNREGGMGNYSVTPIGALAELCCTLIKVAEDKLAASLPPAEPPQEQP